MTTVTRKQAIIIDVAEARSRFAELLRRVAAGQEFVISRGDDPVARLVSARLPGSRKPGSARGLFTMGPDFDAPLSDFRTYRR